MDNQSGLTIIFRRSNILRKDNHSLILWTFFVAGLLILVVDSTDAVPDFFIFISVLNFFIFALQ